MPRDIIKVQELRQKLHNRWMTLSRRLDALEGKRASYTALTEAVAIREAGKKLDKQWMKFRMICEEAEAQK